MRYASTTATLALLLAVTSTLAAPLPRHGCGGEEAEHCHEHGHHYPHDEHHHRHHHHQHHHHHRVSLAKWIHDHLHYPHHWPFHPNHDNQRHHYGHHDRNDNERPKKSGSMLLFWLHSHFAPHTSNLRTHRGKPLSDMNQKVLSSSFDERSPSAKAEDVRKAIDNMHLRFGMVAAKLGNMGVKQSDREIDELD